MRLHAELDAGAVWVGCDDPHRCRSSWLRVPCGCGSTMQISSRGAERVVVVMVACASVQVELAEGAVWVGYDDPHRCMSS